MTNNKSRKTKQSTSDKQTSDFTNNVNTINTVAKLKDYVLSVLDGIIDEVKCDITGFSFVSVKIDLEDKRITTDTDLICLRLETDLEYEARLEFESRAEQHTFLAVKLQAERLGYKLEKIINE